MKSSAGTIGGVAYDVSRCWDSLGARSMLRRGAGPFGAGLMLISSAGTIWGRG